MKHFIFHHNDCDGVFTAALFLNAWLDDVEIELIPLNSGYRTRLDEEIQKVKNPNNRVVVLDYSYSRYCDIWCDHHKNNEFEIAVPGQKIWYDHTYKSCFSLLLSKTKKSYGDVAQNIDKIDSFGYKSISEFFEPATDIDLLKLYIDNNESQQSQIIIDLNVSNFKPDISKYNIKEILDRRKHELESINPTFYGDKLGVATATKLTKYALFYLRQTLKYGLEVFDAEEGKFEIKLMFNNIIGSCNGYNDNDLGLICKNYRKKISGGGHQNAGGAIIKRQYLTDFIKYVKGILL